MKKKKDNKRERKFDTCEYTKKEKKKEKWSEKKKRIELYFFLGIRKE